MIKKKIQIENEYHKILINCMIDWYIYILKKALAVIIIIFLQAEKEGSRSNVGAYI